MALLAARKNSLFTSNLKCPQPRGLAKEDERNLFGTWVEGAAVKTGTWASSPAAFSLRLRQGAMNKTNGDRSFTHGGGHALHVTRPNVPNCKNSRQARFQHLWRTGQRPTRSRPVRMKPLLSRARQPLSQSVWGEAPAIMNTWR